MGKISFISKEEIEREADNFLSQYSPESLKRAIPLDIESIIENQLHINIIYRKLDFDNNLLGMIILNPMKIKCIDEITNELYDESFDRNNIIINSFLATDDSQEHRFRFTLAHELGHWVLHRQEAYIDDLQQTIFDMDYSTENRADRYVDTKKTTGLSVRKIVTDEDKMEWQANYFASCVLMPKEVILKEYEKHKEKTIKPIIPELISRKFNVSPQATGYRLNGLIKDLDYNYSFEGW